MDPRVPNACHAVHKRDGVNGFASRLPVADKTGGGEQERGERVREVDGDTAAAMINEGIWEYASVAELLAGCGCSLQKSFFFCRDRADRTWTRR